MTPETLEALKGSIEKWRRIVEEEGEDHHGENCPLCGLFRTDDGCGECPVKAVTHRSWCEETPYIQYARVSDVFGRASNEAAMGYARDELDFLRSLLPKKKQSP